MSSDTSTSGFFFEGPQDATMLPDEDDRSPKIGRTTKEGRSTAASTDDGRASLASLFNRDDSMSIVDVVITDNGEDGGK
jgi:hypothetical protein